MRNRKFNSEHFEIPVEEGEGVLKLLLFCADFVENDSCSNSVFKVFIILLHNNKCD